MSKKKWWEVYSGDDEKRFFVGKDGHSGLIRKKSKDGQEFKWRSTDMLSQESGLSKTVVEQIIDKYHKAGIVVQHHKDPEKWGYWENVAKEMSETKVSVSDEDKKDRVDKAKKKP